MIEAKAKDLGYVGCGIVPLSALSGYAEKLEERMKKVPESARFYEAQKRFINPQKQFPWAQSVIVVAERYGIYKIPHKVDGHIGKHYLFDARVDKHAMEYQSGVRFERYLDKLGLKFANERKFGLVGLRWAAMQAGIGIIRRNNFFYTQYGSWVTLQAWLIDRKIEARETPNLPPCPAGCNRCVKSCPTQSLSEPYTMSPMKCVSFLTTFGGRDLPNEPLRKNFEECIYGCDICQDVCPMNKRKWEEKENFPGLDELSHYLTPEKILEMDEDFYRSSVQPKFFYLAPDDLWKWKVDALCYMQNHYQEKYKSYILTAREDEHTKVAEMAQCICKEIMPSRNQLEESDN